MSSSLYSGSSRADLRRAWLEAWQREREGLPLSPLQAQIASVIREHPEYQAALEDPSRALDADYAPEQGRTNPFLHMSLHLAVRDQIATDRPRGIRTLADALQNRAGDVHEAQHLLIEALGETLWEAQRGGAAPDEARYLERVRELVQRKRT